MKKAIIVLLIIVMAMSFAGCKKQNSKVTVASDPTFPPFEFLDEETKAMSGIDIDIMNAIAENQKFEVEYVNVGFDALVPAMAACQYDAAISGITITEERKANMSFSEPYYGTGLKLTVKEGNEDLSSLEALNGKVVGSQIGQTGAMMAMEWKDAGSIADFKGYDYLDTAFLDLKNGQIDAVLTDASTAEEYAKTLGGIVTVGDLFSSEEYGIVVCQKNTELLEKINTGLAAIKADGTLDKIMSNYIIDEM